MNILNFEKWSDVVKEGFKADINTEKSENDEIEIEAPSESNNNTYIVDKDGKIKKMITSENGEVKEEVLDDEKLESDIIDAVDAINDIKDRVLADELRRLTGGDKTESTKEIKNILRSNKSERPSLFLYDKLENILGNEHIGEYIYLDISDKEGKYEFDKKIIYETKPKKSVGKGEYLLPLLFDDVYKQKIHGEDAKGDNFIIHGENTYYLELKAPGSSLSVKDFIKEYIKKNLKKDGVNVDDVYKNAITMTFLNYIKNQQSKWDNLYMCIFCENSDGSPKGMLSINVSGVKSKDDIKPEKNSHIFEQFKTLIEISDETSKTNDLIFTFNGDKDNPKIICKLHKKFLNIAESNSIILSRDNFINEYFTK